MTKARIREIRAAAKKCGEGWMPSFEAMVIELIKELERLQRFTRRGITPGTEPEDLPKKAKGAKGSADPRVKEFIDLWVHYFELHHREKYMVMAKDFPAIKRLLQMADVETLLDKAWEAWNHGDKFNCRQAVTVCGFASRYNDILVELKTLANGGRPVMTGPAGCTL